ncbi:MAG: histidine ammonia-lyase [Candidatus Sericytochromatia bacterium]
MEKIIIDGESLNLDKINLICNYNFKVEISNSVIEKVNKSRNVIEKIISEKKVVYGINTGFGFLKNTVIDENDIEVLQENLIISHAAGVGEYFEKNISKAMLLLRANALLKGFSGIRLEVIQRLIDFINLDIIPLVPSQGSVGASGDLAPLSHLVLPLIGKGRVLFNNQEYNSIDILKINKLEPLKLKAKEGLALINGTQAMTAVGVINLIKAKRLIDIADSISATSLEALEGTSSAFRKELHQIRAHKGQIQSAKNLYKMLEDSEIMNNHKDCDQVQDAYSLRCIPQVHGAIRDTINYVESVVSVEINSVTDNPIVLTDTEEIISCGNFHGEPVAMVMDFLSIALSELANISERRIERLVNPNLSNGLPAFLTDKGGLHSGYMIAQYTAAALVSENKSLAHPACVDSIPTSANQEDHVSMGTIGARKASMILKNLENVLAIELLLSTQGLEFRKPYLPAKGVQIIYNHTREKIEKLDNDRDTSIDISKAKSIIEDIEFYKKIESFLYGNDKC